MFIFCIYAKAYNKELFPCLKREVMRKKVSSTKDNFECFLHKHY